MDGELSLSLSALSFRLLFLSVHSVVFRRMYSLFTCVLYTTFDSLEWARGHRGMSRSLNNFVCLISCKLSVK